MKRYILLLLLYSCCNALYAQKILRGKLLSATDRKPVASASVYLSNTSTGTVSKEDGSFAISPFPEGKYDLVVSSLGYEIYTATINAAELPTDLQILLTPKVKEMAGVTVKPFIKNGWAEWGPFFMENLIGATPNAEDCKLMNKDAVRFRADQQKNTLEAVTNEPLVIQNKALGYTLTYDLELFEFRFGFGLCTYLGYPLFTEMQTDDAEKREQWKRNRQAAYEGSMMHFMRSVYQNKLVENGFELRRVLRRKKKNTRGFYMQMPAMLVDVPLNGDSIAYSIDSATVQLQFNDYLQVVYPAKKLPKSYIRFSNNRIVDKPTLKGSVITSSRLSTNMPLTAEIYANVPNEGVQVLYNGHYYFSTNLVSMQYWAWSEKLSNLLPLDYGNPVPLNAEMVYKPH
jgi:CarboxypepD_reg-like domain